MTWVELIVTAWICNGCGIEVLVSDDGLPEGWRIQPGGDEHVCAVCA